MSRNLITPVGKASFPSLFKAKLNDLSGKAEYSVDILFDKKTDLSKLNEAVKKAVQKKWQGSPPKILKHPIKDGDALKANGEPYGPEYKGHFFITVKNTRKPGVVDSQNQPILTEQEIYGGCYIRASINAFAFDHKANKGTSLSLVNVQKVKEGEPFGEATMVAAEDEFDIIDDEQDNPANYSATSSLLG